MKKRIKIVIGLIVCILIGTIIFFSIKPKVEYIYNSSYYINEVFSQKGDIYSRPRWCKESDGNFIAIGKRAEEVEQYDEYETYWFVIDDNGKILESNSIEKTKVRDEESVYRTQELAAAVWENWIYRLYVFRENNPESMETKRVELRLQKINKNTKQIMPYIKINHDFTEDIYNMNLINQLYCYDSKVYLGNNVNLYEINEQGECVDTKFPAYQGNLVWDEIGNVYYIDSSLSKVNRYRLDTYDNQSLFDIRNDFFCGLNIDQSTKKTKIQVKGNNTINTYDTKGNVIGKPIVSDTFNYQKGRFYTDQKRNFYFTDLLNLENTSGFLRVSKVLKPEETLECRSYISNVALNKTINPTIDKWNNENPTKPIVYKDIEQMGDYSQMIQKASTEILTKNSGDLIVLNGLPYKVYMDKGVLMPIQLSKKIKENIHPIAVQDSTLKQVFTVPLGMHLCTLYVNEPLLKDMNISFDFNREYTTEEFFELVDRINKNKSDNIALIPKDQSFFLQNWIVRQYYDECLKKNKSIVEEDIQNWIEKCKQIKQLEHASYIEEDIRGNLKDERSQVVFIPGIIFNFEHYIEGYTPYPMPKVPEGKQVAYPTTVLGIISAEQSNICNEFLNDSLDEENQERLANFQISVNEKVFQRCKERFINEHPEKQDYAMKVEALRSEVNSLQYNDLTFNEIMHTIQACLEGEQDEDKAVQSIIQVLQFSE